jgi:membrane protein YdbS with pleckstrin-like domain
MIRLTCDRCDKPFEVSDDQAGRKVSCPACGDVRIAPGATGGGTAGNSAPGADRAAAAGLPPASGPEVTVLRTKGAPFRTRPLSTLALWVVLLAGVVGAATFGLTGALPLAAVCGAAAIVAAGVLLFWSIASWSHRLEVTNKRVVFTKGLLSKTTVEMLHRTIQDIEIKQSFLDRLLNVGTINIANASEDDDAIVLNDVPNPYAVRKTIDVYRPM